MYGKKLIQRLVTAVFLLVLFSGMIIQMTAVISLYLSYKVESKITIEVPRTMFPHSVSICTSFIDILEQTPDTEFSVITEAEMLRVTPAAESLVTKAFIRTDNSLSWPSFTGPQIVDHLLVSKFTIADYVCYRIKMRKRRRVSARSIATKTYGTGMIYKLILNSSSVIRNIRKYILVMHEEEDFPFRALTVAPLVTRQVPKNQTNQDLSNNWAKVYPQVIRSLLQPSPYEDECRDYRPAGFGSHTECAHQCIREKIQQSFHRLPYSSIIRNSTNMRIFSKEDEQESEGSADKYEQISRSCQTDASLCGRASCVFVTVVTKTEMLTGPEFRVDHVVPQSAWITMHNRPVLTMAEFLTYVMGIIGTYTGLSLMSFEPMTGWRKVSSRFRVNDSLSSCRSCHECHRSMLHLIQVMRNRRQPQSMLQAGHAVGLRSRE